MAKNTSDLLNQRLANYESNNQYLSFYLDQEEYGIEILMVQEIITNHRPTKVPNASEIILGMINFRGKVVPIIDLRAMFGLPPMEGDGFKIAIVLEYRKKNIGLAVDYVSDIVNLSDDNIQPVNEDTVDDLKAEHCRGMGKIGDRLVLLLNMDKVISSDEFE